MLGKVEYCEFGEEEIVKLKNLLGIDLSDNKNNNLLEFAIEDSIEIAMNYCNIDKIPKGLYNTVLRMAMDIYRNESLGEEGNLGSISSISEGDTNINYRNSASEFKDSILKDYKVKLNRYRKVRFV